MGFRSTVRGGGQAQWSTTMVRDEFEFSAAPYCFAVGLRLPMTLCIQTAHTLRTLLPHVFFNTWNELTPAPAPPPPPPLR